MGSFYSFEKSGRRRRKPGKIDSPLDKKLQAVKWGEFKIPDIFIIKNTHNILSNDVVAYSGEIPYLCASAENNAVSSYISYNAEFLEDGNCIFIGGKTFVVSYQEKDFFSNDSHNLVLYLKYSERRKKSIQLYMASCIAKSLGHKYTWGNSISHKKIENDYVTLPVNSIGEIDFDFMDSFIRELEEERVRELKSYLAITGLQDYTLTDEEQNVLKDFDTFEWQEFRYDEIFNHIEQGRRLKKEDQRPGSIPFVMSGITNTGVVNYISNPVASFPANSITVDIFGNTFYRSFAYGLGDDTGAYWNDQNEYTKEQMLFFATSVGKSLEGKYSYGHKLRSSQSLGFKMFLPVKDGNLDYTTMETFMSAIQKLVIKGLVLYAEKHS